MHWGDRSGIGAGEGWSSALARCMLMFARRAHAHASLRRPFDVRMWSAELRGAHRITYVHFLNVQSRESIVANPKVISRLALA